MDQAISYGQATHDFYAGRMKFEEFAKATAPRWNFWARKMTRTWGRLPAWLGIDDLEQELLFEAWRHAGKFDPRKSEAGAFAQFVATKAVAKKVHKARGVETHRRHGASCFEIPFSTFMIDPDAAREDDQRTIAERAQHYEILRRLCSTRAQLAVIDALDHSGGTLTAAASYLYSDRQVRRRCRILSESHAVRTINRAVAELVEDFGIEEARS